MKQFSIRWRMTLWNTAAFAVVLTVFGLLVYKLLSRIHYDQVDRTLKTRFQELVEDERLNANPEERFKAWTRKLNKRMDTSGTVLDAAGNVIAQSGLSDTTAVTYPNPNPTALHDTIHFDVVTLTGTGRARRLTGRVTAGGDTYTVMLMAELEHLDEEMQTVLGVLALTIPVTLAVAAALGYWLARKSLAPVDQLRQLADEITAEHLDRRLPIANSGDELGALAKTINSMISRLERSFGEVRRFTADASHELRTPISVIHSEAEMGLSSTATLADTQNRLTSILEECNCLTSMTDQLLALCREDAGVTAGTTTPIHLAAVVNDAVDRPKLSSAAELVFRLICLSCGRRQVCQPNAQPGI
jgi:two-component system, OmpR family, heavy metal sensor histidine kinase CusS